MGKPRPVEYKLRSWSITFRRKAHPFYEAVIIWEAKLDHDEEYLKRETCNFEKLEEAQAWISEQTECNYV